MSIFGPFLGPFGARTQFFEKFSLTLQSSDYRCKRALERFLLFKTLQIGFIYTLHFFPIQRLKRKKRDFGAPKRAEWAHLKRGNISFRHLGVPNYQKIRVYNPPPYGAGKPPPAHALLCLDLILIEIFISNIIWKNKYQ